jgi:hypothetical protein
MTESDHPFEFRLTQAQANALPELKFAAHLVILMRVANALRYNMLPATAHHESDSSDALRDRVAGMMHLGAHIFEAHQYARKWRRELEQIPAFGAKLAPVLDDPDTDRFVSDKLDPLRNRLTFHHSDLEKIREGMRKVARLQFDVYPLVENSHGRRAYFTYYQYVDMVGLAALVGGQPNEFGQRVEGLIGKVSDLADRWSVAIDDVIAEAVLDGKGWQP